MSNIIYADYAATAPAVPDVLDAIKPWISTEVGYNANSLHQIGVEAHKAVEKAREQVANFIGAEPEEVYFTSGATESINTVLSKKYWNILSTKIEHPAVLKTLDYLAKKGRTANYIPTTETGNINLGWVKKNVGDIEPDLIVMQMANNETGVILPYAVLRDEIKGLMENPSHILLDATQILPHTSINVHKIGCDFLAASAHKFGSGIPGVGILYIKKGTEIRPLLYGGEQENGFRPGTLNVPGIVAAGYAAEYTQYHCNDTRCDIKTLRNYFERKLLNSNISGQINGGNEMRLPGHSSVTFKGIPGLRMQQWLSDHEICVSSGSACSNGHPSHVLKAMGLSDTDIDSTIRFSFGSNNTIEEVDRIVEVLQIGTQMLTD